MYASCKSFYCSLLSKKIKKLAREIRKCDYFVLIFLSFTKRRESYENVKRWKHEESVGAFRARRQEVKTREQFFILRGVVAVIARSFVRT